MSASGMGSSLFVPFSWDQIIWQGLSRMLIAGCIDICTVLRRLFISPLPFPMWFWFVSFSEQSHWKELVQV